MSDVKDLKDVKEVPVSSAAALPTLKPFETFRVAYINALMTEAKTENPLVMHLSSPHGMGSTSSVPEHLKSFRFLAIQEPRRCTPLEYTKMNRRFEHLLSLLSERRQLMISTFIPISSTLQGEKAWTLSTHEHPFSSLIRVTLNPALMRIAVRGSRRSSQFTDSEFKQTQEFIDVRDDENNQSPKACSFLKRRNVSAITNDGVSVTADAPEVINVPWQLARQLILQEQVAALGQIIKEIEVSENHPLATNLSLYILLRAYIQHILQALSHRPNISGEGAGISYSGGGEPYELNSELLVKLRKQSAGCVIVNYENDVDFNRVSLSMGCLEMMGIRWMTEELIRMHSSDNHLQHVIVVLNELRNHRFTENVQSEEEFLQTGIHSIYRTFAGTTIDITRRAVDWNKLRTNILETAKMPGGFRDPLNQESSSSSSSWTFRTHEERFSDDTSKPGRLIIFTASRSDAPSLDLNKVSVVARSMARQQRQTQAVLKLGISSSFGDEKERRTNEDDTIEWNRWNTGFGPRGGASLERRHPLSGPDLIATCLSTRLMNCPTINPNDTQRYCEAWTRFTEATQLSKDVVIDVLRSQLQYRNAVSICQVVKVLLLKHDQNSLLLHITDDYLGMVESAFANVFGNQHRMMNVSKVANMAMTEPLYRIYSKQFERLYADCRNNRSSSLVGYSNPIRMLQNQSKTNKTWCEVIFMTINWGPRDTEDYGLKDGTYDNNSQYYLASYPEPPLGVVGPRGRAQKAPRPRLKSDRATFERNLNPLWKIRMSIKQYFQHPVVVEKSTEEDTRPAEVLMIFCIPVRANTYKMNLPMVSSDHHQPISVRTGEFVVETKDNNPHETAVPKDEEADWKMGSHPHETFMTAYVRTLINDPDLWNELKVREEQSRMKLFVLLLGPLAVVFIGLRRDSNVKSALFDAMTEKWQLPYQDSLPPSVKDETTMKRWLQVGQNQQFQAAVHEHKHEEHQRQHQNLHLLMEEKKTMKMDTSSSSSSVVVITQPPTIINEEKKRGPNDFMSDKSSSPPPDKKAAIIPAAAASPPNESPNNILYAHQRKPWDAKIDSFLKSDAQSYRFPANLSSRQRKYIHLRAIEMGLVSESVDDTRDNNNNNNNKRIITIYRANPSGGDTKTTAVRTSRSRFSRRHTHLPDNVPLIDWLSFTMDLTDKIPRRTYTSGRYEGWPLTDTSIWKTRGAFLREMDFLVTELSQLASSSSSSSHACVIYVDRSPSAHLPYLVTLFKDRCKFIILKTVEDWGRLSHTFNESDFSGVFLICNPGKGTKDSGSNRNLQVGQLTFRNYHTHMRNRNVAAQLKEQYELHWTIGPRRSLLKFDIPYDDHQDAKIEFLPGKRRFEPWSDFHSTECRIVVEGKTTNTERLDVKTHEEQMSYFHRVMRPAVYKHDVPSLCGCYDCRAEVDILTRYLRFRDDNKEDIEPETVDEFSDQITEFLKPSDHRELFQMGQRPLTASASLAVVRPNHLKKKHFHK